MGIDVAEEKDFFFCHRRTRSLPASSRFASPNEPPVKDMRPASPMKNKQAAVISLFDMLRGDEGSASTAATSDCNSPRSYTDTWCSESEVPHVAVEEHVEKLAQLISEECCYLRIEGHRYLVADDREGFDGRTLPCKKNVLATLCIFVANLPWTKRAKWRHPLLRSAASALEEVNIDAAVVGGNLFVTIPGCGRIQVDFAAAR